MSHFPLLYWITSSIIILSRHIAFDFTDSVGGTCIFDEFSEEWVEVTQYFRYFQYDDPPNHHQFRYLSLNTNSFSLSSIHNDFCHFVWNDCRCRRRHSNPTDRNTWTLLKGIYLSKLIWLWRQLKRMLNPSFSQMSCLFSWLISSNYLKINWLSYSELELMKRNSTFFSWQSHLAISTSSVQNKINQDIMFEPNASVFTFEISLKTASTNIRTENVHCTIVQFRYCITGHEWHSQLTSERNSVRADNNI